MAYCHKGKLFYAELHRKVRVKLDYFTVIALLSSKLQLWLKVKELS